MLVWTQVSQSGNEPGIWSCSQILVHNSKFIANAMLIDDKKGFSKVIFQYTWHRWMTINKGD